MCSKKLVSQESFRDLCRTREILGDCFRQPIVLEQAASQIHLSPWHFLREFRRAFGETPHEFLTRQRIDRAKELLATTDLGVTQICFEVGYSSLGSFSSLFARRVGVSPRRYRSEIRARVSVPGLWPWQAVPMCYTMFMNSNIREVPASRLA